MKSENEISLPSQEELDTMLGVKPAAPAAEPEAAEPEAAEPEVAEPEAAEPEAPSTVEDNRRLIQWIKAKNKAAAAEHRARVKAFHIALAASISVVAAAAVLVGLDLIPLSVGLMASGTADFAAGFFAGRTR